MKPSGLKNGVLTHGIFSLNVVLVIGLFVAITNRDYPKVGDDYRIHIPRMLDTHLHHLINGPTIQWYTPSFGGGLPAYPNPLYVQYSLPQALLFVVDPWSALMISTVVYALIGSLSYYLFLKSILGLSWTASALGAIFILANGFYLEHFIAGHIGYQQFPLLGLILLTAFSNKINAIQSAAIIGIVFALMVNQAGFYLIIIFVLSLAICLPLLYLMHPLTFKDLKFARAIICGGIIGVLLSLSKITAVLSFMRYFPRELSDNYGLTYLQGLKGLALQLAGFMSIAPIFMVQGRDLNEIAQLLQTFTGSHYEIWETDISISPAVLLLLFFCVGKAFRQGIAERLRLTRSAAVAIIFLGVGTWLAIDLTLAQGPLYLLINNLPILRSTHVNVRFASAFIFPASILAARGFDSLTLRPNLRPIIQFTSLSALTIAAFYPYFLLSQYTHLRYFDLGLSLQNYRQVQQGQRFPIRRIADVFDEEVFKHNASNLNKLYEAIFGYELEYFHPKIQTGSVFKEEHGYYNMTNPASYVFPEENDLEPFERFRIDQKEELELFINRKQPGFKISVAQHISDIINQAALIGLFFYMVAQIKFIVVKIIPNGLSRVGNT